MSRKTRKLIWAAPVLAVFAVAAALAIFAAQPANPAAAHDPPGPVSNVKAEKDGTDTVNLSWTLPAAGTGGAVDGYRVDRSEDGLTWMNLARNVSGNTYKDTGAKPGTGYYYRVFAVNGSGTSAAARDYLETTDAATAPGRVPGLSARPNGQNEIVVSWSVPTNDGGATVTSYELHFGTTTGAIPGQSERAATNASVFAVTDGKTSFTHDELNPNTFYLYRVYAVNSVNKGAVESDTVSARTDPQTPPKPVTNLTAVQYDSDSYYLYWFAPTDVGGFPGTVGYTAQISTDNGTTWANVGSFSGAADQGHDLDTGNISGSPSNVKFQVKAVTTGVGGGDSSYVATANLSVNATDSDRNSKIPAAPTSPSGSRDAFGNVNLSWTAPATRTNENANLPASIGGYRIDVSDDGINWRVLPGAEDTNRAEPKYSYNDPDKKNPYYRVFAWNAQYLGPATAPFRAELTQDTLTVPDPATGLTVMPNGPTQLDLSWTKPTNTGNVPIDRYEIHGSRLTTAPNTFAALPDANTDNPSADQLFATSKTTSYSHKDLNAGDTWRYRIVVVTVDSADTPVTRRSNVNVAELKRGITAQADKPEAPEDLSAESAKDTNLTGFSKAGVLLFWNAPNPPDGAKIDGYEVQRKKGTADWATIKADTRNDTTHYHDTSEPAADETRMYRVAARNGSTVGDYSEAVTYTTQAHTHVTATDTAPAAQTVTSGDTTGATVDVKDYFTGGDNVTYKADSSDDTIATASVDGSMVTIMGTKDVMATAMATITVTATDDSGQMATQDIAVTVNPANNTPVASAIEIDDLAVGGSITVDADKYFTDADGDALTYTAVAMKNEAATISVSVDGSMVTIKGEKLGEAEVQVTGTDPSGASDTATIMVTVANQDPKAGDAIEAVTVRQTETATAESTITDADGDKLTWTVDYGDGTYATAEVDQMGMVTITGVMVTDDPVTITVTATDPHGASDSQEIMVTVTMGALTAPTNVMATVDDGDPGSPGVTVTWTDGDFADVHHVFLINLDNFPAVISERVPGDPSPMSTTFSNVAAGVYVVAVQSTFGGDYKYDLYRNADGDVMPVVIP